MRVNIALVLLLLSGPKSASANAFEDTFGVGAREKGMGQAGTALSTSGASVYHNPAGLAFCEHSSLSIEYGSVQHNLHVKDIDPHDAPGSIGNRHRASLGLCARLPLGFALGVYYGQGLTRTMQLDQQSIDPRPRFVLHDARLDSLSIMLAVAYRIIDDLSVGLTVSVLANSDLSLVNTVPVIADAQVRNDLHWDLKPTAAIYAGIRYQPLPELALGLTYRSALYHNLNTVALTRVNAAGVVLDVDLILQGAMWYSPQQVALGASYQPLKELTLAADLTWSDWSAYPGPFIIATPVPGAGITATLNFPPREAPSFVDTWIPRLGAEYVIAEAWPVRIGYSFRMTPAPRPNGYSNVLDSHTHVFSVGGGYRWAFAPTEAAPEAPWGLDGFRANVYGAVGYMPNRAIIKDGSQEQLNDYVFGGLFCDLGLGLTLSY